MRLSREGSGRGCVGVGVWPAFCSVTESRAERGANVMQMDDDKGG